MSTIGLMGLLVAFAGVAVSVLCLLAGAILGRKRESSLGETLTWGGHIASILTTVALTVCCGILVYCFFDGRLFHRVRAQAAYAAPRARSAGCSSCPDCGPAARARFCSGRGLSAVFNSVVAIRDLKSPRKLDSMALMVVAAGVGGVRGRAAVQREQHAVHGHAAEVLQRRWLADQCRQHAGHELSAGALGHGHPSAHLVRGLCGPDHSRSPMPSPRSS